MEIEEVKAWCKRNKITQKELAQKIGYSHGMLSQALNGHETFSPRMQEAIKRVIEEHERPQSSSLPPSTLADLKEKLQAAKKSLADLEEALNRPEN